MERIENIREYCRDLEAALVGIAAELAELSRPRWLNRADVKTFAAMSERTLCRAIKTKGFPTRKANGKWLVSEVEDWLHEMGESVGSDAKRE